jgi:hypothetical protein
LQIIADILLIVGAERASREDANDVSC